MRRDAFDLNTPFAVPREWYAGAHLGRVTAVNDDKNLGRVKVELYATDTTRDVAVWARVASPFAGSKRGGFFLPQEGDEVLVIFAGGDPRAPVVIGGLWNNTNKPPETISGKVDRWSITGKEGTRIAIVEESAATATIKLSTPGGVTLTMTDENGGKVEIKCGTNTMTLSSSGFEVQSGSKYKLTAPKCDISAPTVNVDAAMSKFSGVAKADVVQATTTVASTYTPGAGNTW
jgi:phage baseplate assembly protein gpV